MVKYTVVENFKGKAFWRAAFAECLGTAMFIYIGCGSVIQPGRNTSDITRTAIGFGFTMAALVRALGPISGCHLNPSVSLALLIVGRLSVVRALVYLISQLLGAIIGAGLLMAVVPQQQRGHLGITVLSKGINEYQGFAAETIFTFVLVMVICSCTDDARPDSESNNGPMVIGLAYTVLHLMAVSQLLFYQFLNLWLNNKNRFLLLVVV